MITITEEEYTEAVDSNAGICPDCGHITCESFFEPDRDGATCEECGKHRVCGMELALICGYVDFSE